MPVAELSPATKTAVDGIPSAATAYACETWGRGRPVSLAITLRRSAAQCAMDKLFGEQANSACRVLLDAPGTIVEDSGARDRHGRSLVRVNQSRRGVDARRLRGRVAARLPLGVVRVMDHEPYPRRTRVAFLLGIACAGVGCLLYWWLR